MSTLENTRNAIAAQSEQTSLRSLIESSSKELARALPAHMQPERLVRIALTNIRMVPELANATPESFLGALFTAAQIGIEPVAGRAYLLPFKNNRKKPDGTWHKVVEAQFILGYKGLAELFYRHGKAVELSWGAVKEGDDFDYEYGTKAYLRHKPKIGNTARPVAYWVQARLTNGGTPFKVMGHQECMDHGKAHSKTFVTKEWNDKARKMVDCEPHFLKDSPWAKEPEAMCLKTVLIQLAKLLPLSVELQQAIDADESSRVFRAGVESALDIPSTTDWGTEPTSPPDASVPASDGSNTSTEPDIEFGEPPIGAKS